MPRLCCRLASYNLGYCTFETSKTLGDIGLRDNKRRSKADHVWTGYQAHQAFAGTGNQEIFRAPLILLVEHGAQQQALTANLGEHMVLFVDLDRKSVV